jgi:hypothetical protein
MKKLLMLAIFTALTASCSNTDLSDMQEPINQTHQNLSSAREGKSSPLDKDGFIHIVAETDQMFYMGEEILPIRPGKDEDMLNEYDLAGRTTVYCSATYSNGHTFQLVEQSSGFWGERHYFIKHIYPNGSVQWSYNDSPSYAQCSILKWDAYWN